MKYICRHCGAETERESKRHPGEGYCGTCHAKHLKILARHRRNEARRIENQLLRDLCGTSAAAARRDMGM